MTIALTVFAESSILDELTQLPKSESLDFDEPLPAESLADAADAPLGAQEIQFGLQMLTLGISTSASLVILIDKIIDLKRKLETGQSIKVVDASNNATRLLVSSETTDTEIRQMSRSFDLK